MKKTLIVTGTAVAITLGTLGTLAILPDQCSTMPLNYAEVDKQGTVKRVIVADECFIKTGAVGDPADFVVTDYSVESKTAKIGEKYDKDKGEFIKKVNLKETPATLEITATST